MNAPVYGVLRSKFKGRNFPIQATWVLFFVILVWATVLPRIIPVLEIDRGIFVSVAERIRAGDILYQDVWDNKDPLFYLGIAVTRSVSPFADVVVEFLWIASSAIAVLLIARWRGCSTKTSWFVAFGMTPLIITGGFYLPGYTHLPGIALTLFVLAAGVSRKFVWAGALLGVLVFTKIVMLPMALPVLVIVIFVGRKWGPVLRSTGGFAGVVGAILIVLQVRGELQPYVQSLFLNATYSQSSLVEGRWGPFIRHLIKMTSFQTLSVGALLVLTLAWVVWRHKRSGAPFFMDRPNLILWASVFFSIFGAVIVLGFTGLWKHHAQVLYVPAILASIGLVHRYQSLFSVRAAIPGAAFICLALLFSGQASLVAYPQSVAKSLSSASDSLASLDDISPETSALLSVGERGTYARVGQNDDLGHANGLMGWELACPRFHQYPFDSVHVFRDVVACIPHAQVVIVSPSAVPIDGNSKWNTYMAEVESTISSQFSCYRWGDERVCVQKNF